MAYEQPNRDEINEKNLEETAFAQSWNLAVACLPEGYKGPFDEGTKKEIETRQIYFYEKLMCDKKP